MRPPRQKVQELRANTINDNDGTGTSYEELVKSNWGFISAESQEKIRHSRVLLAGCGLGSNIAVLAARSGFTKFVLADGDRVELSNLNRQTFRLEHLGVNKAEVVARLVYEINPQAEVDTFSQFITTKEVEGLFSSFVILPQPWNRY